MLLMSLLFHPCVLLVRVSAGSLMKQRTVEGIIQSSSSTRGSELMEGCMGVDGGDGQKDLRQGGNCCSWVLHCFSVSRAQLSPVESPEENVTSSSLTSSWLSLAATGIFLSWISPGGGSGQPELGNESPKALCRTFPFPKPS